MDFLGAVINFQSSKCCFLCFKKSEDLESIMKTLYIYEENNNITSCIHSMMSYLFPTREILFKDVCQYCSKLIMSMYLMLRRHDSKKIMFGGIVDDVIKNINKAIPTADQPLHLHIKMPQSSEKYIKAKETYEIKTSDNLGSNNEVPCETIKNNPIKNEATICDVCGKVCRTPNTLKSHLNCHREKSCPHCFKVLKTHSHFKLHVKCHEGFKKPRRNEENFYYCNDCEYRSLNKCSLQAHINKYHLRVRPFVCEICMKGFYKKSNLTEHVLTHRTVKNLTCEQCGENFVCKKTLAEHIRLHTGQKPFQCNICNANFVTSGRRSDHMKRKHGQKNECCNICGKKYSLRKDLNSHVKRVHVESINSLKVHFFQTNYEFVDENGDVLPVLSSIR